MYLCMYVYVSCMYVYVCVCIMYVIVMYLYAFALCQFGCLNEAKTILFYFIFILFYDLATIACICMEALKQRKYNNYCLRCIESS